jgi:hypothetical protein
MQGTFCPPSRFCGVPECGQWSNGSTDHGVPCNDVTDLSSQGNKASAANGTNGAAAPRATAFAAAVATAALLFLLHAY